MDSSKLVTALAERDEDLTNLITDLNTTTRALANQKGALAESIDRLPPFMRRANTTFVNLRAALDDVDPLVDASEPVARVLTPFLAQARGLAADAEPTIRDLRLVVRRSGPDNDLVEFLGSVPPLVDLAVETRQRNGDERPRRVPRGGGRLPGRGADHRPGPPLHAGLPRLVRRLLHDGRQLRRATGPSPAASSPSRSSSPIRRGPPTRSARSRRTSSSGARAPPRRRPTTARTCSRRPSGKRWTATSPIARRGTWNEAPRLRRLPGRRLRGGGRAHRREGRRRLEADATRSSSTTPSGSPRAATSGSAA